MKRKFTKLMAALALLLFIAPPLVGWGQSTTYSSNLTFNNLSSNSSSCTVSINNSSFNGVKMGTSSNKAGSFTVTIPSGTTKLHIHAAGWSGKSSKLSVTTSQTGVTISPSTQWSLTDDSGISGSGTSFTLATPGNAPTSYYKEYTLTGVNTNTVITIANSSERAVVWGVNAENTTPPSTDPICTITPTEWNVGEVQAGSAAQTKEFTVTTANLTSDLTVELLEGDFYSVDVTSIGQTETSKTITVTLNPTAVGSMEDILMITGDDINIEVGLTATGLCNPNPLAFATPVNLQLTGDDVEYTLTPTTNGNNSANITYEVTQGDDNHGIVVDNVFTADALGTWVVTATQAAYGTTCEGTFDITINVFGSDQTITFDAGTGSCTLPSQTVPQGTTIQLPTATPSQACQDAGWTFVGWTDATVTETQTAPTILLPAGEDYTVTTTETLYAVYMQGGSSNCSVTFSESGYENGEAVNEASIGNCATAEFDKGSSSNDPKYYDQGTAIRLYAKNTMTVTGNTLSNITLTFGTGDGSNAITTNVGTYTNGTWTGSASSVTFTVSGTTGNRRIAGIAVTTSGGTTTYNSNPVCLEQVAIPTFNPAAGEYTEAQNVTIACATDGATILYKTSENAEWQTYSAAINVSETTTIWAKATKEGMADSEVATAAYTIVVPLSTIAEIFAAATTTETNVNVTFGNWVVSGVSGSNAFVTDNNGNGFIIYKNGHGFTVNDKLSGTVMGTPLKLYNGSAEFTNLTSSTSGLSVSNDGEITIITDKVIADLGGVNTGAVIMLNNLSYDGTNLSDGTNTIKPYNTLYGDMSFTSGKTYNVTGVYQQFGNTKEILPRSADDIEEVVVAVPSITLVPDNPIYTEDGYHLEFAYYSHGGAIDIVQPENFQDVLTYEDFFIQYCDADGQPIEGTPDWLVGDGAKVELGGDVLYLNVAVKQNTTGAERSCYFKVWALNGSTNVYSDLVTVHQADKPVINANDIVLFHDATSGSIAYTISNPIANTSLTATLQEGIDWISDINVGETAVTFNTTANTGAIRTATITLTYKDTDNYTHATKVVTVTQILPSVTGTITFGSGVGSTNINKASVTGKDSLENEWTITTTGTQSYTPNQNYAQVGSSGDPAETITFTTSLGEGTTIASIEAKFGGNNSTAGDINLFVGNINVGEGALNGTADVIVQSTTIQEGNAITVTVSNIARGVKCYYISYSYVASTAPYIDADEALPLVYDATSGSIHYTIGNPVEGGVLTASINEGSTIADLAIGTITNEAVPFTCLANDATTPHTATITLTYKKGDEVLATKNVTVTQDRVPMQNVTMAFHPTAAMATIGVEAFTAPTLTINPAGLTVTYSSSNTTVATVDETTGEVTIGNSAGIAEITATFAGNDAYFPASALYTLFVNDNPDIPVLTVDEANITQTTAPVLWTPCANVNAYTLDLAPVAISESFEGNVIPDGWTNNGVIIASGKGGDGIYCIGFNGKNDNLITPALNNPKAISFMYKRSSNSTAWSLEISYATSLNSETWTPIGTVSDASTDWQTFSASLLNVTGDVYIKFTDTRGSGTHERYIDLVQIAGEYTSQSVTATSYTFENLAAGATYYARVKGNEEYSNVVSFTTLPFTKEIAGYGNSEKDGYYLIASPISSPVTPTAANGFVTSEYDLYIFDQSESQEWRNYQVLDGDEITHPNFTTIESGKGYLYASSTTTTLTFTGKPYEGDGIIELNYTEGAEFAGWNLIGNPFDKDAMLSEPYYSLNEDGSALNTFMEENTVEAMEGVFVKADAAGKSVTFTPASTSANSVSQLNIKVTRNRSAVLDNAIIRFDNGAMLGKFQLNPNSTTVYFTEGNHDYAIVSSEAQGEMPVNFKAENNGTYTIAVEPKNVEMTYLHLIDNMTGADIDLLAEPSYTFEAKTNDYASRFRLVFSANEGSNENATETFAFFNGSEWQISNVGEATLQVVDMMGRVLSSETISGNAEVNINQAAGIYMLRLVNGDDVKVQKVVVK